MSPRSLAVASLLASSLITNVLIGNVLIGNVLLAQTPPCISLNDANTSVSTSVTAFGFAGPGIYAYQFTPSNSTVLFAAEIYTEAGLAATQGYMSLEIWDTNFIFLPQSRLGGGTWQNQPSLGVAWQGANFDVPVPVSGGQTYWLVWRESGFNRLPYEPGGTTVTTARFTGGTWQTQATSQAIKWRGYCSQLDDANVQPVGLGCLSSLNTQPAAFTNNEPSIGNAEFQVEGTGFPSGSFGLAILGTDPTWPAVPVPGAPTGCELYTDAIVTLTVSVGTGNEQAQHSVGALGHVFLNVPVPATPSLAGTVLGAQFAVFDPALTAPLPFTFSNGVQATLF